MKTNQKRIKTRRTTKKEILKAELKGALTLPFLILQVLLEGSSPPKHTVKNAIAGIDKAIKILKEL